MVNCKLLLVIFILSCYTLDAQDKGVLEGTDSRVFELVTDRDTIQFVKVEASLFEKKPVLLFLQGSLPIPLSIKYPQGVYLTSFPFSVEKVNEDYHLVVISMPHIPLQLDVSETGANAAMSNFPLAYNRDNFLENYVRRAENVIDFVMEQDWSDEEVIIFGHSQGSLVATKLSSTRRISKLALSGFNPNGRYDQYIKEIRLKEQKEMLSSAAALEQINEYYARWEHIVKHKDDDTQERGDTFKATYSFSENMLDDLLLIDTPVYIMYGSKDVGASGCDILPLEFARAGKTNLTLKSYPGLGHNFEEIDFEGKSNFDKMYWQEAFDEFLEWLK